MILKEMFDDKLKDCFMGGIPMKELIFDLQRFDAGFTYAEGVATYKDAGGTTLFTISGLNAAPAASVYDDGEHTVTFDNSTLFGTGDVKITKVNGTDTYTLVYTTPAATYAWTGSGQNAEYDKDAYYAKNDETGDIEYHAKEPQVKIKLTAAPTLTEPTTIDDYLNAWLTVNTTGEDAGTITVKNANVENGFSITSGDYTIKDLTVGAFTVTASSVASTAATDTSVKIMGKWSKGYWLDSTKKKLNYKAASTNDVLLATVRNLKAGDDTDDLKGQVTYNHGTPTITLKAGALNKKTVTITKTKAPDGSTTGNFTFSLYGTVEGQDTVADKVTTFEDAAATNIWEVKGTTTATATYKNVTPAYYTVATGGQSVTFTQQATNATYGVIKNLVAKDENDYVLAAYNGYGTKLGYIDSSDSSTKVAEVIKGEEGTDDDAGKYIFTVQNNAVLPSTGSTTLTSTYAGSKFVLGGSGAAEVKAQVASNPSWTFTGGKATLSADLTKGHTLTNNDTTIKNADDETGKALVEISGLDPDIPTTQWTSNTDAADNPDAYYTVEGVDAGEIGAGADSDSSGKIKITLKAAALTSKPVSVVSKTDSFKYELALAEDAQLLGESETNANKIPRTKDVWVFSGTTATYKQVQPEYWTLNSTTGKIEYHRAEDKQIYATIKGLDATAIASLKYSTDGDRVGTVLTDGSGADDGKKVVENEYLAIKVEDGTGANDGKKIITLNNSLLPDSGTSTITLANGKNIATGAEIENYILAIDTTTEDLAVAEPDITHKWWTVDGAGTATLHQQTDGGYKVENAGKSIKFYADVDDAELAKVTGLSTDVVPLDENDEAVTGGGVAGVKLGIPADDSVDPQIALAVAHNNNDPATYNSSDDPPTYKVATEQAITLTDAMLDGKKVTLTDKNTKDSDTFKLMLATGEVTTETAAAKSWAVGGTVGNTTLTYQSYNKGFYTLVTDGTNANKVINYTKETAKNKLFTLTVKGNDDLTIDDTDTYKDDSGVFKVKKDGDWVNFVTVGAGTVTVTENAAYDDENSITFKHNNADYSDYKLVNDTGSDVTYTSPTITWAKGADSAWTLSIAPDDAGYELSDDEKTLTYQDGSAKPILSLTGINSDVTTLNVTAYDPATKTVTLNKDVLSNTKVSLKSLNKDSYTLALGGDVPTDPIEGYTWTVSAGTSDDVKNVVAKRVEQAYYTEYNATTINYVKEKPLATLFTINGLNATFTPASGTPTELKDVKDDDAEDFTLTDKTDSTEYISFDANTSEVTVNESLLPTTADAAVTLKGTGWKFANYTEPEFSDNGTWTVNNGVATLTMSDTSVTPGWKATNNGQKLTRVNAEAQTLFTITGLATPPEGADATAFNNNLKTALADAYDPATHKVTLPKEVLGETATKIKLTPNTSSVFKGDGYTLALASDVAGVPTENAYDWSLNDNNLAFKSITTGYFTADNADATKNVSYTYHKASNAQTVFTLQNNDLFSTTAITNAILVDKDGDATLTDKDGNALISVDTATNKVTLSEGAISGTRDGGYDEYVTLKNSGSNIYAIALGDLSAPEYTDGTWTHKTGTTYSLTRGASNQGYELTDSDKKLTYVDDGNTKTALEVSGIVSTATLIEDSNIDFDPTNNTVNTVTIKKKDLLTPAKISLKSIDGGAYALALGEDIRTETKQGYSWKLTSGKIEAKYVTRDYYESTTSTTFTYHAEKPNNSLFTITYEGTNTALHATATGTFTAFTDDDGDNILNNGDNQYLSFDTTTGKVTVLDETNILPKGNGNTFKLTAGTYTFEDNVETPLYNDTAASWTKAASATTATLSITPERAGYTLTNSNTLTYVATQSEDLATLSGLKAGFAEASLQSGAEVDVTNKIITLSENVLKNGIGTSNKLSVNNGYKLAIDPSAEVQVGTSTTTQDVWQLGAGGNAAYYRKVSPEYYMLNSSSDAVTYHAAVKQGEDDIFSISGLKSVELNEDGQIAETATSSVPLVQLNNEDASNTVVSINDAALATGTTISLSTEGTHTYKFELADGESARTGDVTWEYNSATDKISVIGTYTADKFLVSDDKKSIKPILGTDGSTGQTLATISGIDLDSATEGSNTDQVNTYLSGKFEFDDYTKTITFKDDSLLKDASTVTISDTDHFYNYKLALDTSEINTNKTKDGSTWDISSAAAVYKNVYEAAYTLDSSTFKSITTTPQSQTDVVATVTGLKAIESTQTWVEGSSVYAYSIVDKANTANVVSEDAIRINTNRTGEDSQTVFVSSAVLPDGTATSVVSVTTTGYRIALNPTEEIKTEAEYSAFTANQATGTTTFAITANHNAYYTLTDSATKIAYTPSATGIAMATLTGLRTATSATSVDNATTFSSQLRNGITVDNDEKTITIANSAMSTTAVQFNGNAGSYTLALADEQNTTAADIWEYSSGTATFKNTTPEHYELSTNRDSITYFAAADMNKYFSISGLNTTTETTKVLSTTTTALGDSYLRAGSGTTAVVEYDGNDIITLHAGALSTSTGTVVSLKDENTTDTKTYQFALGDDITPTTFNSGTVTKLGLSTLGTDTLKFNSGTRSVAATVTYEAPIQQGYVLSDSNTKVSIADGTGSHKYFTINGLQNINSSTNLTSVITVENDVVTITKEALGNSDVTLVDADPNDGRTFTLALDNEVKTTADQSNYWTFSGSGTRTTAEYKTGTDEYYTLDGNSITYNAASSTKVLAKVTGLKTVEGVTVDDDQKKITVLQAALTDTKVEIIGTSEYTFNFTNSNPTYFYKWSYESRTGFASLDYTPNDAKYTLNTSTNKTITYTPATQKTNILTLNNLDSDLATTTYNASTHGNFGSSNGNGIDGIKVEKTGETGSETLTVTINSNTLKQSSVNLSGNTRDLNYTYKLAFDNSVPTNSTGSTAWDYNKATNGNVTFSFKASIPVHYSLNSTSTTAVFHQSSTNTTYATVIGKATDFNSAIQTAISNYDAVSSNTSINTNTTIMSASKTAIVSAFTPYVNVTGQTVTFKANSTDPKGITANSATYVTVSTPQVGTGSSAVQYMSQISGTSVVQATDGATKTWSLKGSSLILSTPLTEGYTFNGNKLYYANANANGDKIFTISGLDLTDAKADMVNYDSTQQAAIDAAQAIVDSATAVYNTAYQAWRASNTTVTTAEKNAAAAALSASETYLAGVIATQQSTRLGAYLTSARIDVNNETNVITIAKDLLGTSNVDITNNGDVKYTLATTGVDTEQDERFAGQWTFSGGTATLKETKDAFYTPKDASSSTIVYNKPAYGSTLATIKGLATSVYKGEGNDSATAITTGTMVTNTTKHTVTYTTTQSQDFWTDMYVPESKDGVIGIKVNRRTQPTITTTTVVTTYTDSDLSIAIDSATRITTSVSKGTATTALAPSGTWVGGASALSTTAGAGADTRTTIALSSTVLGTTTISLTGTDYKLSIAGAQAPAEVTGSRKWTGSLGGTSAVLTADFQEGWTLDTATNKVTYTAAKDDATLLTVNGIKINITSTDTNLQAAIDTAVDALRDANPTATAAETRTAVTAATNAFISNWVSNTVKLGATTDGYVPVTVNEAALNETNITAKSGDRTTTYKLVLGNDVTNTATASTYSWNGLKYQSLNSAYYSTNTSLGITFNKANNIVTLATLKGIVGSSIPEGAWRDPDGDGSGTLTLSATTLGTSTVSLTGDGAGKVTLALANATNNTLSTGAVRDQDSGTWVVNGTTALKKNGYPAFYTLDTANNKITYTAESGTTKTFATIRGLKSGFTGTISDSSGEVTLTDQMVGTSNITITKGNATIDALTYKFALGGSLTAPVMTSTSLATSGVNTTLKAEVGAGWDLDATSTTAIYTPDASNKALAIFVFNSVGLDETNTNVAELNGKVYTLKDIGENNKMITIKTNPGNLDFNITDTKFNGSSAESRTTLVGSAVGEGISVTGANQVISGLGGDDVISLSSANGASVNGGVGADHINIGTDAKDVTILGDAANDVITGTTESGNNSIDGGAGDDNINLTKVGGNVTIQGNTGNDSINVGDATGGLFNGGAGADIITLASANAVSIYGEAANDEIRVTGAATNSTIWGGAGMDSITIGSAASGGSILGEAGNDEIYVEGDAATATIDGGAGSDIISIFGASSGLILGDIGNDSIKVDGAVSGTINGGAGNDSIVVSSGAGTVIGGAGNDEIALGGTAKFYYANGDGNDTITGYATDNFILNSGEITSASVSGGDTILKIGSYRVTLKKYEASDGEFSYTSGTDTKKISIAGGSSDLLYDTNGLLADDNLMTPNDISELVSTNSVTEYHVGNINTNIMAPDQILSEGDLISYGNQQKKNNK